MQHVNMNNRATAKKRFSERMVNTTVPVQTLLVLSPSASIFLPMLHTCMSMTTLYTIIQIQILVLFPSPPSKHVQELDVTIQREDIL